MLTLVTGAGDSTEGIVAGGRLRKVAVEHHVKAAVVAVLDLETVGGDIAHDAAVVAGAVLGLYGTAVVAVPDD